MAENLKKTLTVSGLAAGLIFLLSLSIYLGNLREYSFTLLQLTVLSGAFSLGVGFLCALVLLLFSRSRIFPKIFLAFFSLSIYLWLQGSFLLWPLGGTPDTIHDFASHPVFGTLELVIFAVVLGLVFRFGELVHRKYALFTLLLLASQILALFPALTAYRESSLNRILHVNTQELHRYSEKENVIFLVLDSLEDPYFRQICDASGGAVETLLKDFEYFPRFLSMYPQTFFAMPTLLTGSAHFDETKKWDVTKNVFEQTDTALFHTNESDYFTALNLMYGEKDSFLRKMSENGFRNELYSFAGTCVYFPSEKELAVNLEMEQDQLEKKRLLSLRILAETIIPHTLYRLSPLVLKPYVFHTADFCQRRAYRIYSGEDLLDLDRPSNPAHVSPAEFQAQTTAQAQTQSPNPTGSQAQTSSNGKEDSAEIAGPFHSPNDQLFFELPEKAEGREERCFKLIHLYGMHFVGEQNEKKSVRIGQEYLLHGISAYLNFLKKEGFYENSWIVICGDHGFHSSPVSEQFHPVLLVKRPGVTREKMKVNESAVLLRDAAPTILSELNIQTGNPYSFWNPTEEQKKEREELWQKFYVENLPK